MRAQKEILRKFTGSALGDAIAAAQLRKAIFSVQTPQHDTNSLLDGELLARAPRAGNELVVFAKGLSRSKNPNRRAEWVRHGSLAVAGRIRRNLAQSASELSV